MVVALLYAMQSPCNCFTLSLSGSDSRRSNSWRDDDDATMKIILKLFPFSLKGDAKAWYNTLAPSCVCSPQDMIYYFSEKYFPAHKKQAALQEIFNFVQIEEESLPQAWGASPIT